MLTTWTACSKWNQRTQLLWSCCKRCRRRNKDTSETLETVVRIYHCTVHRKERARPTVVVLLSQAPQSSRAVTRFGRFKSESRLPKAPSHQTCFWPVYCQWNKQKNYFSGKHRWLMFVDEGVSGRRGAAIFSIANLSILPVLLSLYWVFIVIYKSWNDWLTILTENEPLSSSSCKSEVQQVIGQNKQLKFDNSSFFWAFNPFLPT